MSSKNHVVGVDALASRSPQGSKDTFTKKDIQGASWFPPKRPVWFFGFLGGMFRGPEPTRLTVSALGTSLELFAEAPGWGGR